MHPLAGSSQQFGSFFQAAVLDKGQGSQHSLVWEQTMRQTSCLRLVSTREGSASVGVLELSATARASIRHCQALSRPTDRGLREPTL
jgi:hypothetical protein